jgi:hypothetical protein
MARNRTPKTYDAPQQAMERAVGIIRQHLPLIPGFRDSDRVEDRLQSAIAQHYLNIEWERGWGLGCSLSISIRHGRLEMEETRIVHHREVRVEVGWSSTGRGPAEAVAAVALYQQVTQLACLIESVLGEMEIAEIEEKAATEAGGRAVTGGANDVDDALACSVCGEQDAGRLEVDDDHEVRCLACAATGWSGDAENKRTDRRLN